METSRAPLASVRNGWKDSTDNMDGRTITINDRRWRLRYIPMRKYEGQCDAPNAPGKEIRIARSLLRKPVARAEVLIHEVLHAHLWDLVEDKIDQIASDLIRILDREECLRGSRHGETP